MHKSTNTRWAGVVARAQYTYRVLFIRREGKRSLTNFGIYWRILLETYVKCRSVKCGMD
jgi:hypothetical protein